MFKTIQGEDNAPNHIRLITVSFPSSENMQYPVNVKFLNYDTSLDLRDIVKRNSVLIDTVKVMFQLKIKR